MKEGEGPVVIKILRQGDPNFETEISKYHSHALSLLCHLRFLFQSDWLLFFRGLCIIMIISCISMSLQISPACLLTCAHMPSAQRALGDTRYTVCIILLILNDESNPLNQTKINLWGSKFVVFFLF